MPKNSINIEIPDEIKGTELEEKYLETAKKMIREQTVLRLFEQGEISSGYGARLLGVTRQEFITLLGKRGVPFFNYTKAELEEELRAVKRLAKITRAKGGRR